MKLKKSPTLEFAGYCYGGGEDINLRTIPDIDLANNGQDVDYGVGTLSRFDLLKKRLMPKKKWIDFITKKETKRVKKDWQNDLKEEVVEAKGQIEQISIHMENDMKSFYADIKAKRQDIEEFEVKKVR